MSVLTLIFSPTGTLKTKLGKIIGQSCIVRNELRNRVQTNWRSSSMTGSTKRSYQFHVSVLYRFTHVCPNPEGSAVTCLLELLFPPVLPRICLWESSSVGSARARVKLCLCCWHPLHQSLQEKILLNPHTDLICMSMAEQFHRGTHLGGQQDCTNKARILQSGSDLSICLGLVFGNLIVALLLIS